MSTSEPSPLKIVVAGANGFLGRTLAAHLSRRGCEVVGLVRVPMGGEPYRAVRWDGETLGEWADELEGADALVNLAGRSVNCRYDVRHRREILDSRLVTTRLLGEAVRSCRVPPRAWLNSSTATIYRHAEDRPQDEGEGELGEGFSVEVARAWEQAFFGEVVPGGVRKLALRTAIVLGPERGTVFAYLWRLARWGLGGPMGSGRQMVSWIHSEDFARAVEWLIRQEALEGIVNLAAPEPIPNAELMGAVREVAGRGFGLPTRRWMLEVGAVLLQTETELVLKSRWVLPSRLKAAGFRFLWPSIHPALGNLAGQFRAAGGRKGEKVGPPQMKSLSVP